MRIRISSRKSDLARLQAYTIGEALQAHDSAIQIEYRFKESLGDINLTDPLWKMPEKGVFTEDFYMELLNNETDLVVHSWKDLPTEEKPETSIVATLERADQRDVLLFKKNSLKKFNSNFPIKIYSSSPRREYNLKPFLKKALPYCPNDIEFLSVRGNIPTRISKLIDASDIDGLIVAKAAIDRLITAPQGEFTEMKQKLCSQLAKLEIMVLPLSANPNAAAQGALAVEIRNDRAELKELLKKINHDVTFFSANGERQTLKRYGGGCHQKIGVAVIPHSTGWIESLKGLTHQEEHLDRWQHLNQNSPPKFKTNEAWSQAICEKSFFTRESINISLKNTDGLFVSKSSAWQSGLQAKYVWTSGLMTWFELAKLGVWVHGTQDSLGEATSPAIDAIVGGKISWTKLTHADSASDAIPEWISESIGTYALKRNSENFNFSGKKIFYWSSSSLFKAALAEHPSISEQFHCCGPGKTYLEIKNVLDNKAIPSDKVSVFLNEDDWRKSCLSN